MTLTPAERAAVEQRPTRYLSAFLAYCRGVRAEALGDLPAAHAAFQAAVHIDPGFQLASAHMAGTQPLSPDGGTPPAAPPPPPLPPTGVVEALNPSPAGMLGTIRDRGDANQRAILESGALATIFIKVFVP